MKQRAAETGRNAVLSFSDFCRDEVLQQCLLPYLSIPFFCFYSSRFVFMLFYVFLHMCMDSYIKCVLNNNVDEANIVWV